jgi:hypothetical protein
VRTRILSKDCDKSGVFIWPRNVGLDGKFGCKIWQAEINFQLVVKCKMLDKLLDQKT